MVYTESEAMEYVKDNDVKFVKLAFCDAFGIQKNISIVAAELEHAFSHGVPFDASEISGFAEEELSDLLLFPDPSTLSLLPWRPMQGSVVRFFCDIKKYDGTPYHLDGRHFLKDAAEALREIGLVCSIGTECEFYLFKTDGDGNPTDIPFDNAGYMDVAPEDKGENVRRDIILTLEEMGIYPQASQHKSGPGQNEIDFKYGSVLSAADNVVTFKSVVKTISARNGLYATFEPKPIPTKNGNGFHINLSFRNTDGSETDYDTVQSFVAGVMAHICEMTVFLNPTEQSYERLGTSNAPSYVTWSHQNRSQLIRIPKTADSGNVRVELRSPDNCANPYIAFALIIMAGIEGIKRRLKLTAPVDLDLYTADESVTASFDRLPKSRSFAAKLAALSDFIRRVLPESLIEAYCGK